MRKLLFFFALLLFVPAVASAQAVITGGGSLNIGCIGSPGNTIAPYRQICQTSAGALYACNNPASCTVAADWVASGGGGGGGITALTQDVTASGSGSVAATVVGINGTLLSSLATGILYNTTSTGIPSIATSANIISLWTGTCSSSTYLSGSGACSSPPSSGTVNSGLAGQLAYYATSAAAVSGNVYANISNGALTLGLANTTLGQLILEGSTSGALTITPQATAGTPTWTAGTSSGTPAVTASAPLSINSATGNIVITGAAGQILGGSTPAFTPTPVLGVASTTTGTLGFNNASNAFTFTIGSAAAMSASSTMVGPISVPANNDLLSSVTAGATFTVTDSGIAASSGTITTGTWHGSLIGGSYGGTGVNNGSSTITIGGNLTLSGAYASTFTFTGTTSVTFPTSGTLSTTTGTVTSVATTSPITGGTFSTSGTIACATCATTTNGGALSATPPVAISAGGAISITGAAGQVLAGSGPAFTATPTLGASGTLGSITFGNATSGTLTMEPLNAALGTITGDFVWITAAPSTNVLPKFSGVLGALTGSLITDNGTTATYTGTGGYSAPVLVSTVSIGTAPLTVTSTTQVANLNATTLGGINLGTPVAGGIGYGVSTTQIGTTAALTQYGVLFSGGTGAPTSSAQGGSNFPLVGQGAANPTWSAVSHPNSCTQGGLLYGSTSTALTCGSALTQYGVVLAGAVGSSPVSTAQGGSNFPLIGQGAANPIFSTIAYPTSLTSGGILYGSSTTAISSSALLAAGATMFGGGAATAPTAGDIWLPMVVPAANCNNTTAGAGWSIPSGGTVTCRAGTNNLGGYITITDTSSTFAQFMVPIPNDWDTASDPYIRFAITSSDTTSGHTIIPQIKISCPTATNGTVSDDHAFAAAHSLATITIGASAVANGFYTSSVQMNSTDMSGCVVDGFIIVQVGRATDTATSANFYYGIVTWPHATPGTAQAQ